VRVAALDLGSNSFLLTIVEFNGEKIQVLHDEGVVTRLGQEVGKTKKLHPEALARAEDCFREFSQKIKKFNVDRTVATATSAARDATNGSLFIDLGKKYDIPIEIITGQREAELTYGGGLHDLGPLDHPMIIDVGGGSTEFMSVMDGQLLGMSLDIGSVRLSERHISGHPVPSKELQAVKDNIEIELRRLPEELKIENVSLVAVAGTPTTLMNIINAREFDWELTHGKGVELSEAKLWLDKLADMSTKERLQLPGMQAGREDVIVAGLQILVSSMEFFNCSNLTVSCAGVRYGLVQEALKNA
tara:strand:- start:52099 stop:53004 length:906 start_codon:yes stop_codon:yes gene_type:complete